MSESTNNSPIELEIIDQGTEVLLKFTGVHYKRLQELLFHGLPFRDLEHLGDVVKQIQANDYTKDSLAYHVHTILSIINDFEAEAKKLGKVNKKKYDPIAKKVID